VGGSSLTGTGRSVARPGVRLVATGPNASALAWTQYDGTRFRVAVADVAAGRVRTPQTVSPADDDAVLGDLASSPAGGRLVLWRTGTRGADPGGAQRVAAAVRSPGAAAFGAPELMSEPVGPPGTAAAAATTVPSAPSAAVDQRDGRRLAALDDARSAREGRRPSVRPAETSAGKDDAAGGSRIRSRSRAGCGRAGRGR
jgi:hypothetical protein